MNKDMQQYLDKAEVLIEALPYIQRFNRKIIVVKYGGSAMVDEELKARVIQDVTLLKLVGFKPIIVHGGGKEISRWVGKVGMKPEFKNGLRVTDVFSALAALLFPVAEIVGIGDLGDVDLAVLILGGNSWTGLYGVGVRSFRVVHRALFGGLRLGLGCVLSRGRCFRSRRASR